MKTLNHVLTYLKHMASPKPLLWPRLLDKGSLGKNITGIGSSKPNGSSDARELVIFVCSFKTYYPADLEAFATNSPAQP